MPRTFTLQRLMLAITLFCIVCGLLVAYPQLVILAALIAPVALVWLILAVFSRRPWELLVNCAIGAFIGLVFLSLSISGPLIGMSHWQISLPYIGALLLGTAALADDFRSRHQRP